jgi:hypothetical protein
LGIVLDEDLEMPSEEVRCDAHVIRRASTL